jgi:hypothetical protein
MAASEFWGISRGIGIDYDLIEIDALLADGAGHDVADDRLGNEAEAHQQPADGKLVVLLLGERDTQLVSGDQPLLDQ